jgi:hypothetical protein
MSWRIPEIVCFAGSFLSFVFANMLDENPGFIEESLMLLSYLFH